ncbi:uncharacterized protein RAG0_01804 [Rhynchosporium agropyri]|uniref:Uncharacterized protein n=2 Tax=Rhynchosporium TaxID=38037 RepID=A0A1E1JYL5_9HELO|nr:uncharacterized protein RAG0_01804 [Rhynchosporium agropyri]CZT12695.1 uncharacterized protein RCO7_15192 [Rhynchosporium commune]
MQKTHPVWLFVWNVDSEVHSWSRPSVADVKEILPLPPTISIEERVYVSRTLNEGMNHDVR